MTELERDLLALGRQLDYPPQPDLAVAVGDHLAAGPPKAKGGSRPRAFRTLVIAALVVLALAATALAVSPAARDALRDLFDIGGVAIETTTAPAPEPARRELALGERATVSAARDRLGFRPLVPSALGHPDATFADLTVGALVLVYRPGARLPPTRTTGVGLVVTELPGRIAGEYLHKVVPQATTVERLRVGGRRAAWIAGAPHFFFYGRGSSYSEHRLDVAQNVLLLDRGKLLVRLEGAFSRSAAERIARSLQPR